MTNPQELDPRAQARRLRATIVAIIVVWTLLYNWLIKGHNLAQSFFGILDTISDDFVMGTALTVVVGIGIVLVFSVTKLYTQITANVYSFRILEILVFEELAKGRVKEFVRKLLNFEDLPQPKVGCPQRVASVLMAISFIYLMSCVYVVLFSEALFFLSWSAGVDLNVDYENPGQLLLGLPTLALAIPFSARVMAYARYPYAQDYADFMPGGVFVLLLVGTMGWYFESTTHKIFLVEVWKSDECIRIFIRNGVFLAFIPVFFEGAFWLYELSKVDDVPDEPAPTDADPVDSPADAAQS